jgi:hypothetical protein
MTHVGVLDGDYDSDADGLGNLEELRTYGTTPLDPDSDNDDLIDGLEIDYGTDPLNDDSDSDLLLDGSEVLVYFTNPLNNDTDSDGLSDSAEIAVLFTNATYFDTDYDWLSDYDEVNVWLTDPLDPDVDGDGVTDYDEVITHGINPFASDTDADGLNDYFEIMVSLSEPHLNDTDSDGLDDGYEYLVSRTNTRSADSDGDALTDYQEVMVFDTDPLSADTDQDGLLDGLDFDPRTHWGLLAGTALLVFFIAAVSVKRIRDELRAREPVTTAEPTAEGLEPGMEVVVEYKIREGKVVFGVVVRNNSKISMQNVQVTLGVPDLTDSVKCEQMGIIDSEESSVIEMAFELQPGAEGELVGMLEYDTLDGEHRTVNLRPVKIVA